MERCLRGTKKVAGMTREGQGFHSTKFWEREPIGSKDYKKKHPNTNNGDRGKG